jgi:hypothetical protein
MSMFPSMSDLFRLVDAETRSISAENPDGARAGGAKAAPGDDPHCTAAASVLGRGWKVRPCLRNLLPGQTVTIADVEGPGVIQHIWMTVYADKLRGLALRVYYDGSDTPSIVSPLGDFFANGLDGLALVASMPVAVNPRSGMNSYWPMPFRKRVRIDITNDNTEPLNELFYQITWSKQEVPEESAYLHASWRRSMTTRENPEHVILDGTTGQGHYVGTYVVWNQLSNGWWGEGEVKFYIDGDPSGPTIADAAPTICGTGTEDYFGGAWGFIMDWPANLRPTTYTTAFLGYPQAVYDPVNKVGPRIPSHALYRWHVPDPIRFKKNLRVTVQALGWYPTGKYQPLTDDLATVAYWYQTHPGAKLPELPGLHDRLPR